MPPGGWHLRVAVTALISGPARTVASLVAQAESKLPRDDVGLASIRRHNLWPDIREQLHRGELIARGFRHGQEKAMTIDSEFLAVAEPNYDADTLEAHGVVYHDVRILPGTDAPIQAQAPPPKPSEAALAEWFCSVRVPNWPPNQAPPSGEMDRVAAQRYFGVLFSRGVFRRVRKCNTPQNWRKSGRRRAPTIAP